MYCYKCGNQIDDNAEYCPRCGAEQKRYSGTYDSGFNAGNGFYTDKTTQYNFFAVLGFILACVSLFSDGIFALAGVILASIGLYKLKYSGEKGKALAISGIVIAAVVLLFRIGGIIYLAVMFNNAEDVFRHFAFDFTLPHFAC